MQATHSPQGATKRHFGKRPWQQLLLAASLIGCGASQPAKDQGKATEGYEDVQNFHIVDCLLPGKVNRLGGMTYVGERRGIRTTAENCNLRGGEYVAYDRADYRSALNVWLASAQKGDAEAQTYVGEIFEKGLGQAIDYSAAAFWYKKAADQGYKRAQINLGFLYEKGLGVEQDLVTAINYFRSASGVDGELMFADEAKESILKVRNELESKIKVALRETQFFQTQIAQLEEKNQTLEALAQNTAETNDTVDNIDNNTSDSNKTDDEIALLQQLYQKSQTELKALNEKIDSLPTIAYRSYTPSELLQPQENNVLGASDPLEHLDLNFGRYYALIIGNQDYQYMDDLASPIKDAMRLKEVLEKNYGFTTLTLFNAKEKEILKTFNDLYSTVGPNDNLLVFYAGHGNLSKSDDNLRNRGYWLPTNAKPDVLTNWISNSVISDHLDRIQARSILVIADSCFAGNLAEEKSAFLLGGMSTDLSKESIKIGMARRSRIVISSGGEKPVIDGADGQHSVFANALIKLLENNSKVLRENMLFSQVAVNVSRQARLNNFDQTPEMRPIRAAGHEGGDFYFVPAKARQAFDFGERSLAWN